MSRAKSILYFPFALLFRLFLGITFSLFLCIISPFLVYKYVVTTLAPTLRPDLGLMLSPQTRFFLPVSGSTFNIIITFRLTGKLDYPRLVNQLAEKCILLRDEETGKFKFPEFQQYVTSWLGYPFWKNQEPFVMGQHTRHLVLTNESELDDEYQKYIGIPFSVDRSPWEATFLEIQENPNCHYFWFKYHHTLGDGKSLSQAFMGAADSEVQEFQGRPEMRPSCWTLVLRSFNFVLTYFRLLHKMVVVAPSTWDGRDLSADSFMTSVGPIPLSRLKEVSRKFGVSVYAIFISIVSGAIRRKFLKEGVSDPPKDIKGITFLPLPHPSTNLTNNYVYFEMIYPSDKSDLVERVAAVENQIEWERRMKTELVPHFLRLVLWSLPNCLPFITPNAGFYNPISIFPGPTAPVYFGGNFVEDMEFNVNTFNLHSLMGMVLAYNGQCRFTIVANGKICNSQSAMEEFGGYILEELQEMDLSLSLSPYPKGESV